MSDHSPGSGDEELSTISYRAVGMGLLVSAAVAVFLIVHG